MIKRILCVLVILCTFSMLTFAGGAEDSDMGKKLVINSNLSDPAPKAEFAKVVEGFKAAYPDIDVTLNTFDHESYKTAIRNFLVSDPPDITLWYAGNRMKFFVDQGLLADISDVWTDNGLDESMSSTISSLTIDGKQYGVPYGYYQWGLYYRKDILDQYGLSAPKDLEEFISVGETLIENGITPVTIGTKFLWTAAGWFDYLNLRINGFDFHMELMAGDVSYLDPRLDRVFEVWGDLVKRGFFLKNHETYSWQEAQAPLINGEAAMYLIGNFMVPDMESAGVKDKISFARFPIIDPSVGLYEEAPTDTYHIPSGAKNMEEAKIFLAYVSTPEVQAQFASASGVIAPNKNAPAPTDRFAKAGFELLAESDALSQFYDRDTNPEMAKTGMEGFQKFMVKPDDVMEIREAMETERKAVFGK